MAMRPRTAAQNNSMRQAIVGVLATAQCLMGAPVPAQPAATARRPPAAPTVRVNRTVPRVKPPASDVHFSAQPTVAEVLQARVFAEPLVPVGGVPSDAETRALAGAITRYRQANRVDEVGPFEDFLIRFPESPWRASLQGNLGRVLWARGAFSRALAVWDDAWQLAKAVDTPYGRAVAGDAVGSAVEALATLGKPEAIEARLRAIAERTFSGRAAAQLRQARVALAQRRAHPDDVIPSGTQAVLVVSAARRGEQPGMAMPRAGGAAGQTLADVDAEARRHDLALTWRVRPRGAPLPVPAIVHLNLAHYTAIVEARGGWYRLRDPALGGDRWIRADVLDEEGSGYAMVPSERVPAGWAPVSDADRTTVVGYSCSPGGPGNSEPPPCPGVGGSGGGGGGGGNSGSGGSCGPTPCGGSSCAMPTAALKPESAGLTVTDTPVGYVPARGPAVPFTVTYDFRQALQPQIFSYTHLGPQWTLHWVSYAQEVPIWFNPGWNNEYIPEHLSVYLRGGGEEIFAGPPDAGGTYPAHWRSRAQLVRVSTTPIRYERRLPDGGVEIFALADAAPAGQRRVFLTEVRDAHGDAVTLTYDALFRLVAVTDALGQVSTLQYGAADDGRRLTGVTDPFGRTATFIYTAVGQLASVTDVGGLTSSFAYGAGDFLAALTTPYGTTTFRHEATDPVNHPWIEITDPLGGVQRAEYHGSTTAVPASVPAGEVPAGFAAWNTQLDRYVTLSWDARAWAAGPGSVATATVTRWFLQGWNGVFSQLLTTPVPQYVQRPGEARVWYAYPGQNRAQVEIVGGWATTPSEVARVLEGGVTQRTLTTVNAQGHVTARTDAAGRQTAYTYAANGIDLLEVRQTTGGASDLLASYGSYTATHQPQTITDGAGQTTTLTYAAAGQVATVTNARGETTTYAYDPNGQLTSVTGPVAGATTSYTYDGYGRVRTVTADGATVTTEYDVFDRPTAVWSADGTVERTTYDRLDVATQTDRLGRQTRYVLDAVRRRVATRDAAGRSLRQVYGPAGDQLIDANGHATTWERDVQGRVTREVRADGLTATVYTYAPRSGRLATVTDPKGQVTTYTYGLDDAVSTITFSQAAVPTPGVSYTYDPVYPRVTTMTDGTGTTAYTYHPAGGLGAGQVATVDGPLPNDTITYTYDVLGRVASRAVNGVALALTYDALGRVTQEANALGTFGYAYDGPTGRLATVTYPNGQTSAYSYLPAAEDHRLQTIHHRFPNATTLSRFDYTYDAVGNILTWQQQAGSAAPERWRYGYDRADQLTSALKETTDPTPAVLQRLAYGYDPAGNRVFEQIDDGVTAWSHDSLNRLVAQAGGGVLQVVGTVNEPATVTIQGKAATVSAAQQFTGGVAVVPGTNVFTIRAVDPSGNAAEATYEVDVNDAPKTFTYDANGNLTADGTRSFEWDARNQLVAVTVGTHRSEFVYDGLQRRVRQVEKDNGVTSADTRVLWCETAICEERAADGVTVTRRAFGLGEQIAGQARFFATDHLGSVREVTDATGTLLARYAFDPWGRRSVTAGTDVTTVGFTGHRTHTASGLAHTLYRGYDAGLARWVSEDPIGYFGGAHLYQYVDNSPSTFVDALGLTKGGRQNISVTHKGQELTTRSSAQAVKQALNQAVKEGMGPKHVKALKGLLKVIRRGGTMGIACVLMDCDTYIEILDCLINPQPDCFPSRKPQVCET